MKLVEIHWLDPWSPTEPWVTLEDIRAYDNDPHRTVGYLLPRKKHKRGKDWIVVVGTTSGSNDTYGGVTAIHKSLIVKQHTLKRVKSVNDKGVDLIKD